MERPQSLESPGGMLWRVLGWILLSLLICSAWAAALWFMRGALDGLIGYRFFVPAVFVCLAAAWPFGLYRAGVPLGTKTVVILASFVLPVVFMALYIAGIVIALEAAVQSPPPVAQGQHFTEDCGGGLDAEWSAALRRTFPPGTREAQLVAVLSAQGFAIDKKRHQATMTYQATAIGSERLQIDWTLGADARIATVQGSPAGSCW